MNKNYLVAILVLIGLYMISPKSYKIHRMESFIKHGKIHEKFDTVVNYGSNDKNNYGVSSTGARSFGTVLIRNNIAYQQSKNFRTIKPTLTRPIPKTFDGREVWKYLITPVRNQGVCGNCYAYGTGDMLADRFCIMSLGQIKFIPSPSEIAICSSNYTDIASQWGNIDELKKIDDDLHKNRGCNGATLFEAIDTLYTEGITTSECFPSKWSGNTNEVNSSSGRNDSYNVPETEDSTKFPYCYTLQTPDFDTCVDKKQAMRIYRAKTGYTIPKDELSIMAELCQNGPVTTGIMIYNDFMNGYDGKSIYTHPDKKDDKPVGGHCITIYGYGEEFVSSENRLVKYWIMKNSWGSDWGLDGFFKIERNLAGIELEDNCICVIPDFPGMVIINSNIQVIETQNEKDIYNFKGHILDPITGFYESAIEKVKTGKLLGKIEPYINENFHLPDYTTYWAIDVNTYISKLPDSIPASNYLVVTGIQIGKSALIGVDSNSGKVIKLPVVNYSGDSGGSVVVSDTSNIKKYLLISVVCILVVVAAYWIYINYILDKHVSSNTTRENNTASNAYDNLQNLLSQQ